MNKQLKKNKFILGMALASLMLASCQANNQNNSSSSISNDDSSQTDITIDGDISDAASLTVKGLVTTLKQLANEGIYDVKYKKDGVWYTDTMNAEQGYYWISYDGGYGYAGLPQYPGKNDAFFSFDMNNGSLTNVHREVSTSAEGVTEAVQPTIKDMNVFAALKNADLLNEDNFTQISSTKVNIKDSTFAYYISILFNYSINSYLTAYLSDVTFQKNEYGSLYMTINTSIPLPSLNLSTGIVTNIGNTERKDVADAIKSYAFPTETISDAVKATLNKRAQEMDVEVTKSWTDSDGVSHSETYTTMRNRYDLDNAFYCTYNYKGKEYKFYYAYVNPTTHELMTKAIDAKTGNVTEKIVRANSSVNYALLRRFTPLGCLDMSAFYGSGTHFEYYGGNETYTGYFLSSYLLLSNDTSLSLDLNDDGSIKCITGVYSGFQEVGSDYTYTYTAIYTFKDLDDDAFPEMEGYEDTEDTLAFKNQFITGKLDGTGNVKMETSNLKNGYRWELIEADNIVLRHVLWYTGTETTGYTRNPSSDIYEGYKYDESKGGVIPFTLKENSDGSFTATAGYLDTSRSMTDFAPFGFASSLVNKGASNTYSVPLEGLTNLNDAILYDENLVTAVSSEYSYVSQVNVVTDGTDITSVSYSQYLNGDTDGEKDLVGTTTYNFTYGVNQKDAVIAALENLEPKEIPTSWKEELSSDDWNNMVAFFGEDAAKSIPYFFNTNLGGKWKFMIYGAMAGLYVSSEKDVSEYTQEFFDEWSKLVTAADWEKLDDTTTTGKDGTTTTTHYYKSPEGWIFQYTDYASMAPSIIITKQN